VKPPVLSREQAYIYLALHIVLTEVNLLDEHR